MQELISAVIEWSAARQQCLMHNPVTPAMYDRLARAEAALQMIANKLKPVSESSQDI